MDTRQAVVSFPTIREAAVFSTIREAVVYFSTMIFTNLRFAYTLSYFLSSLSSTPGGSFPIEWPLILSARDSLFAKY
jgi:hypothetical protein